MSRHNKGKKKSNKLDNFYPHLSQIDLENLEEIAFNKYLDEMFNFGGKFVKLDFYNESLVKAYGLNTFRASVFHYLYRTDPNNWKTMYNVIKEYYNRMFPNNPNMNLGISSSRHFEDLISKFNDMQNSIAFNEKYINGKQYKYVFSRDYIDTVINAKKVGLYHFESPSNHTMKRSVDIVGMVVDNEVLIGEIATVYNLKSRHLTYDETGGSVIFNIFYKGDVKTPVPIRRDDFIPKGCSHFDKIDKSMHLKLDLFAPKHTKYSHSHILSDPSQLPFPKANQSVNVEHMPININNYGKEIKYKNLSDMQKDSFDCLNYDGKILDYNIIYSNKLKQVVLDSLKGNYATSEYGKFISDEEFNNCVEIYNSSIDDVRQNDQSKSVIGQAVNGSKDNASVARDIRQAYFEIMNRKCIKIKSKNKVQIANPERIRKKPNEHSKACINARYMVAQKKNRQQNKYGIMYSADKNEDIYDFEQDRSNEEVFSNRDKNLEEGYINL